jgi:hypothetical protein
VQSKRGQCRKGQEEAHGAMIVFRMAALAFAKTFSKLFGVATITFFGRVPSRDDDKVAFVGVASLAWLFLLPAMAFPGYGEAVLPFLPDDEALIRGLATALAVGIPPLNGIVLTRMHNRGGGTAEVAKHLAFGYGYAVVVGLLVVALVIVVPIVKFGYLVRMFDLKHIAVMIDRDDYDDVLAELQEALARHGIDADATDPNPVLKQLFRALSWVEGRIFRRHHMARDLKTVKGELDGGRWFEVTLHATDISIIGKQPETTIVSAILAEELDSRNIYFSWDDDSQALEDRIRELRDRLDNGDPVDPEEVRELSGQLKSLELSLEEWNSIRRLLYRLEIECQKQRAERKVEEGRAL